MSPSTPSRSAQLKRQQKQLANTAWLADGKIHRVLDLAELEQQGLEIFGLSPKFSGLRWIARHGTGPLELALAHGDPRVDPVGVLIVGEMARTDPEGIDIYDTLARMLMFAENEAPFGREGTPELADWVRNLLEQVPGPEAWQEGHLNVCGVSKEFRMLHGQRGWVAVREFDSMWLYAQSLQADPISVEITRVQSLAPYIEGTSLFDPDLGPS